MKPVRAKEQTLAYPTDAPANAFPSANNSLGWCCCCWNHCNSAAFDVFVQH